MQHIIETMAWKILLKRLHLDTISVNFGSKNPSHTRSAFAWASAISFSHSSFAWAFILTASSFALAITFCAFNCHMAGTKPHLMRNSVIPHIHEGGVQNDSHPWTKSSITELHRSKRNGDLTSALWTIWSALSSSFFLCSTARFASFTLFCSTFDCTIPYGCD